MKEDKIGHYTDANRLVYDYSVPRRSDVSVAKILLSSSANEECWRADGGNHSTVHSLMLIMTVSLQKNIRDLSGLRPDLFSNLTNLSPWMYQLWKQVGNSLLSPPHCSDHILQMEVLLVTTCYMHVFLALLSCHSSFYLNPMYVPRFLSVVYTSREWPLQWAGTSSGPCDLVLVRNVGSRNLQHVHAFQSTISTCIIMALAKFHCILFTV